MEDEPVASEDPLDAPLSVFRDAGERTPEPVTSSIRELIDDIRGDQFRKPVERIRALATDPEKNRAAIDKAKKLLPAVMISGMVTSGDRGKAPAEGRFAHSGWLQGDFDGKDHRGETVNGIIEHLALDRHVQAVFLSPTGTGAKAVIRIPVCESEPDHKAAFEAAATHFAAQGLTIDPATKDPGRLCFVSYDPDAWLRDELAEVLLVRKPAATKKAEAGDRYQQESLPDTTTADIREMLAVIPPRPEYHEWLRIASAVWSIVSEAEGIALLNQWSPEEKPGEYARKFKNRLKDVKSGTLVWYAQANGFDAAAAMRRKRWAGRIKFHREVTSDPSATDAAPAPASEGITPDQIFYDAPAGKYFVDTGTHYDAHARPSPLLHGLELHFAESSDGTLTGKQIKEMARESLAARSLKRSAQWCGAIAGHRRGFTVNSEGQPILITSEPRLIEPEDGPFPVISKMLRQAFPERVPMHVFLGWLAGRVRAVREGVHMPAPALVLAAGVNKGKSLLAKEVIAPCLGGRAASPLKSWAGLTLWNDDLLKAELLLVDDEVASTDIRSRRNFGASLKTAMFAPSVAINRRNNTSIHVRPVWSVVICCNDTPEALQIIPPLDADLSDKVILLRPEAIIPPTDTSTPAGRKEFQELIRADLPQFVSFLDGFTLPADLQDSRSGVKAWRDAELLEALGSTSPEHQLEELLVAAASTGWAGDWPGMITASDLMARLCDANCPVRDQARSLLSWPQACGTYLARLADNGSEVVKDGGRDAHKKIRLYALRLNL